jgi:prepilin-type N-terminal cleavage/methylation domain-containing protein
MHPGRRSHPQAGAFSLLEIVIALTILAVLAGAAVPAFTGIQKERVAREPIAQLLQLAKTARMAAIRDQKPYQVALSADSFVASRYFDPYLDFNGLTEFLTENELLKEEAAAQAAAIDPGEQPLRTEDIDKAASQVSAQLAEREARPKPQWTASYKLPPNTQYMLQYWHETIPTQITGEVVKLWVFQPSGICEPLKLHLETDAATFDVEFSALTVDIVKEAIELK